MQTEPRLDRSVNKIIIIDNIPKVGPKEKKERLKKVLSNLLKNYGKIVNDYYPEDENQVLKGYLKEFFE